MIASLNCGSQVVADKTPDKGLAGGGVAFKLAQALLQEHHKTNPLLPDGQTHESFEKWLLDMGEPKALGNVCAGSIANERDAGFVPRPT